MAITKEKSFETHLNNLQLNNTNWKLEDISATIVIQCSRLVAKIDNLQAELDVAKDELSYYVEFSEYIKNKD